MASKKRRSKPPREVRPWHRKRWVQLLVICGLVFAVYGNTLENDYNVDDGYIVPLDDANPLPAQGISGIPEILNSSYNTVEGLEYGYRPMGKVTMAIEYELWGNDPFMSHLVNLLLYALHIFILLLFLERVAGLADFRNVHVLYIGLLIFLVHPVHTEVVASIKNREEILSGIFMFSALLVYLRYVEKRGWYLIPLFILLSILAFLSKETAFNIIGIIALLMIYQSIGIAPSFQWRKFIAATFTRTSVLFLFASAILFLLVLVIGPATLNDGSGGAKVNTFEVNPFFFMEHAPVIPNAINSLWFYVRKLCWPDPLLFYYGYNMIPVIGWGHPVAWVGLPALLVLAGACVYLFRKRMALFPIFWIAFFLIAIFPFINVLRYVSGIVGERLAYQASLGFAMLLAILLYGMASALHRRWKKAPLSPAAAMAYGLALLIVVPMSAKTYHRNFEWKDKLTLYEADIVHLSGSARANQIIANTYMKQVDALLASGGTQNIEKVKDYMHKAKVSMKNAVTVYDGFSQAWFDLGRVYLGYERAIDSALYCLDHVEEGSMLHYPSAKELMGDIHLVELEDTTAALSHYLYAYRANPDVRRRYEKFVKIAFEKGEMDAVKTLAQQAVECGFATGLSDMGDVLFSEGDTLRAGVYYQAAWVAGIRNERIRNRLQIIPSGN